MFNFGLRFGGAKSGFSELIHYTFKKFGISAEAARYIINEGKGGNAYNATMHSGNHISLNGADQYIDYPVIHDLGSDTKQAATLGSGWTNNGNDAYTASSADGALSNLTSSATQNVQISFTISNYSAGSLEGKSANGDYIIDVTDASLHASGFSGDVQINSVKEITIPTNSYVSYYDSDTKKFVQYDHTTIPPRTYYRMTKSHQLYMTHTASISQADIDALNANPNLIMDVWFNGAALPSGLEKANIENFCAPIEGISGASFVIDLSAPLGKEQSPNPGCNDTQYFEGNGGTLSSDGSAITMSTEHDNNHANMYLKNLTSGNSGKTMMFTVRVLHMDNVYRMRLLNNWTLVGKERNLSLGINMLIVDVPENISKERFIISTVSNMKKGDTIVLDEFSIREVTAYEIKNYTSSVRDSKVNQNFGVQNFLLTQNKETLPIGASPKGQLAGSDDDRYIEVPDVPTDYQITDCTSEIYGDDSTNLTIETC